MDSKEIYEEAGALADLLPDDQRERFAAYVLEISQPSARWPHWCPYWSVRRWAMDAGHLRKKS
jgi:hypothetical protein